MPRAAYTIEEVSAAVRRFEAESKTDTTITPWAIVTWLEELPPQPGPSIDPNTGIEESP